MPARTACSVNSGPLDQRLERDHRAPVDVERVEAFAEVARHVGQPRRVEQREHLVVFAPQLAQPLHGQRVGRHHQAALAPARCATRRFRISAASTVLPRPTSSASSHRTGSGALARSATCSWWGNSRTRPPRNGAQAVGLAQRSRCRMSSRVRKSPRLVHVSQQQPLEQGPLRARSATAHGSARSRPFARRIVPSAQPRRNRRFLVRRR